VAGEQEGKQSVLLEGKKKKTTPGLYFEERFVLFVAIGAQRRKKRVWR